MGQLDAEELQETLSLLDEDDPMFEARVTDMVTRFRNRMFNEGEAEGFAEGVAKGKAEGRVEGALENAMKNALSFLKMGLDPAAVSEGTGLPLDDVKRLAAEMR